MSAKKCIAAALGSGGAKGMAHVGALKALEECGIRFCAVAGTSIGSIVGALYAKGYSPSDISGLLQRLDLKNLAISVLASASAAPVRAALDSLLDESDFSALQMPFAAVATDTESGEEVVLRSGNVAEAVLASSAMPPFFKSVNVGGRLLADGAFTNAVPGDVARSLGADFVLGISLSPAKSYERTEFFTAGGVLKLCYQKGIGACDYLLEPDLSDYAATDAAKASVMYDIGYECAMRHAEEIAAALRAKRIKI